MNQQAVSFVNCHAFWNNPRNDNYFWSSDGSPSAVPHPRNFHMDNIFASEGAMTCAPYNFPYGGIEKKHATFESPHYPIVTPALEDLQQTVTSFHNPSTKMTDLFPNALDIDLFLEEIFEAVNIKSAPPTPCSTMSSSTSDTPGNGQQQPPPSVAAVSPKPAAVTRKRVTKAYSPSQKIHYVDLFRKEHEEMGRSFSQRQFARKYQLSHARFSAWCKEYNKFKSLDASQLMVSRVRVPSGRYPVLESRMTEWIEEQRLTVNAEPTIKAIQSHARELATQLGINDFVASNTWVERFRRRSGRKPVPIRPASEGTVSSASLLDPTPLASMEAFLQDFRRRKNTHQPPLEMAGLGVSPELERTNCKDGGKTKRACVRRKIEHN